MGIRMKNLNQEIIKFDYDQNFKDDDFYVSKSNKHIFDLLNKWPKWEKNFLNISGENFSTFFDQFGVYPNSDSSNVFPFV